MAAAEGFPTVDHPAASLSSEDDQGSVCSLGSGVTGTTYDVGEDPEWDLLVSTSATASARPTSAQAPDVAILMEGWVRKQASKGVPGFKPWQPRYFVLLGDSLELRYVRGAGDAIRLIDTRYLPLFARGLWSPPLRHYTGTMAKLDHPCLAWCQWMSVLVYHWNPLSASQ